MQYNNLIYFLVVILLLTTNSIPDQPQYPFFTTLSFLVAKLAIFRLLVTRIFGRLPQAKSAEHYAAAERKGSILAIVFFALDLYLLDIQYFFSQLPLAGKLPVLVSFFGIALFSMYLALLWLLAHKFYQRSFGRVQTPSAFLRANFKINLPIILPWLSLSLLADLLQLAPLPAVHKILRSAWGEPLILILFFFVMITIFPAVIVRIWSCTPLPAGPVRQRIEQFCITHNIQYRDIVIWPLFEGQALTAGVMGFMSHFRYFLITPALIQALTPDELEAVIAHEVGHVKKRHLQLYIVLFLGFGLLAQLFTFPLLSLLTDSDLFYKLVHFSGKDPGNGLALASTIPTFFLMIVYFRFVMGYFMRNFERQADLYALKSMKSAQPIIQVFEKIAWLSGNTRDVPSWHHFSLGQRIRCLEQYDDDPMLIKKHDAKVRFSLLGLIFLFIIGAFFLFNSPHQEMSGTSREKFAVAVIENKIRQSPQNESLNQLLGDIQYSRKKYPETIKAYQKVLSLNPENFEVLNNLAWLYLTAEKAKYRNPVQALALARQAVILTPQPHVLDTLALAYWQNGYSDRAITTIQKAIEQNPEDLQYYKMQLKKFRSSSVKRESQ